MKDTKDKIVEKKELKRRKKWIKSFVFSLIKS